MFLHSIVSIIRQSRYVHMYWVLHKYILINIDSNILLRIVTYTTTGYGYICHPLF